MIVEKVMEIWTCGRYSEQHPEACVEPAKIKIIPLRECQNTMEKELSRQKAICREKIIKLETEINKLKTGKK
jgi:hypothetical protein